MCVSEAGCLSFAREGGACLRPSLFLELCLLLFVCCMGLSRCCRHCCCWQIVHYLSHATLRVHQSAMVRAQGCSNWCSARVLGGFIPADKYVEGPIAGGGPTFL